MRKRLLTLLLLVFFAICVSAQSADFSIVLIEESTYVSPSTLKITKSNATLDIANDKNLPYAPVVLSIKIVDASPTNASTVNFTVVFSEAVTGVDASDFSLSKSGAINATIGTPTGSGTTWNVPVENITGVLTGTLRLDFTSRTGVLPNAAAVFNGGESYTMDFQAPTVASVLLPQSFYTFRIGEQIEFRVTFNSVVVVNTSGGVPYLSCTLNSGTVKTSYVSGSGTNQLIFKYTVVAGDFDDGSVTFANSINANGGTIRDIAGNNANLALNSGSFIANFSVDGTTPQLSVVNIFSNNVTTSRAKPGDVVTVTFTSAEPINTHPYL